MFAALGVTSSASPEALSQLLVTTIALALQFRCTIHNTGVVVWVIRIATGGALRKLLLGCGIFQITAFLALRPRIDAVLLSSRAACHTQRAQQANGKE
jgi:hypothetical protein